MKNVYLYKTQEVFVDVFDALLGCAYYSHNHFIPNVLILVVLSLSMELHYMTCVCIRFHRKLK